MNILVVNPNARADSYSGPNIFMERLFRRLGTDHEVTILTGDPSASRLLETATTVVPTRYQRKGRIDQLRWAIAGTLWILRHGKSFDVVHLHGCYSFNLALGIGALNRRLRLVLVPLGARADFGRSGSKRTTIPLRAFQRAIVRRAHAGLCLSTGLEQEFEALGLDPAKIAPIGNPVDTDLIRPPEPDARHETMTIGFVGVLGHRKGAIILLEALASLRNRNPLFKALFVGPFSDESFRNQFESAVDSLGLVGSITVTGYQTNVAPFLNDVGVFVLPSNQEGLPGALVEAMAAGLPCLVTDVGAMGNVVTESKCGTIVEANASSLAEAIFDVFESPDEWHGWSKNSRFAAVRRHSIPAVAEQYEQALKTKLRHSK